MIEAIESIAGGPTKKTSMLSAVLDLLKVAPRRLPPFATPPLAPAAH